jgi:hypothetical protein
METVDEISQVPRDQRDKPLDPVVMEKIELET